MKPDSADRWNEWTALKGRNKPAPPSCSWWVGKSGAEFSEAVKAETPRMSASNVLGKISPMIVGGQP